VIEALLFDGKASLVHAVALGRVGGGLFAGAPGFGGLGVVVVREVSLGQRFPVGSVARIARGGLFEVQDAAARLGIAFGERGEGLVELGIEGGGAAQRGVGLGVVGLKLGVFDIGARAGAAGGDGGGEVGARIVLASGAEGQQAEPFVGFGELLVVTDERFV